MKNRTKLLTIVVLVCAPLVVLAQLNGALRYSSNILTFWNGSAWMSTDHGNTGAACSTPGSIRFNSSTASGEFCNGTTWRSMNSGSVVAGSGSAGQMRHQSGELHIHNGTQWVKAAAGTTGGGGGGGITHGYFVVSSAGQNGNFGGLDGAHSYCHTNLNNNDWKDKGNAGTLSTDRVKAFLCDTGGCENPWPETTYYFAVSGNNTLGGASFTTDALRTAPNNSTAWNTATYFGTTTASYWMGRGVETTTSWVTSQRTQLDCAEWTNATSSFNGYAGTSNQTQQSRWSWSQYNCDFVYNLICMVHPEEPTPNGPVGATVIILRSGSTWTVPANWNSSNNKIEVIGGGGGGAPADANSRGSGGGGGGAYASVTNLTLTPSSSVTISVGVGGSGAMSPSAGGDTWFNGASAATASVAAGGGSPGVTAGAGGAGGTVIVGSGSAGGAGGSNTAASTKGGGGGGGAGGPNGVGAAGGTNNGQDSGGGGGGGGGGSAGSVAGGSAGGNGGNRYGGGGAGTGGASGAPGGGGGYGSGGGGCGATVAGLAGGPGGNGQEFSTIFGSGGGGGGGCAGPNNSAGGSGGLGGTFGGGGGGGGATGGATRPTGAGGRGAPGVIVITYTP